MNIKTNEVYSFKITSGEELIARVVSVDGTNLVISEPVSVAPGPQGVGLMPSFFTADPKGEHRLNTNLVVAYALTDSSVKTKYLEAITGLVVPEKKLILG